MAKARRRQSEGPGGPDAIQGVPEPRETLSLFGHEPAEQAFLEAIASGRLHHGWLICGPRGIGKATLAFQVAKYLLCRTPVSETSLKVDVDDPAVTKIRHRTHPNVLYLHRPWDEVSKRFKTEISVDNVRQVIPFLGATAAEGRWRVVIVDSADNLNRNSANALLKSLEEPPRDTVFLLVSSRPGLLPPTIRSRCRVLWLSPLGDDDLATAIQAADPECLARPDRDVLITLAEGSPRRAIELAREGGVELHRDIAEAIATGDPTAMHAVANAAADARGGGFDRFTDLYFAYLHRRARGQGEPGDVAAPPEPPLATWAGLWEKAARQQREVESLNLDRKHHVLALLEQARLEISRTAQGPARSG